MLVALLICQLLFKDDVIGNLIASETICIASCLLKVDTCNITYIELIKK
jgi:hypothetical protein